MRWMSLPEPLPEPGPDDPDTNLVQAWRYLRSYRRLRTLIGVIGIALPFALLIGDAVFLDGDALIRGSLSAYYHSGMRDVFVGTLCATGVFLITYRVVEPGRENALSTVAGFAALGVALFPTRRPADMALALTPLQQEWGETTVATIHFASAVVFIGCLAIISYDFGTREERNPHRERTSRLRWRTFHRACAAVIVATVLGVGLTQLTGVLDRYSLLVGETVAVLAFGLSWLAKGWRFGEEPRSEQASDPATAGLPSAD